MKCSQSYGFRGLTLTCRPALEMNCARPSGDDAFSIFADLAADLFTGIAGGQTNVLRRSVQPWSQTWIDLLWGQAWLPLSRGERLCGPALSRNRRNAPRPRRRAIEYIREARCDLPPQATKSA